MLRRLLAVTLVLATAVSLAACGGSSSTEAPSPSQEASMAPAVTPAPSVEASVTPAPAETLPRTVTATCDGVGLRTSPSTTGSLVGRVSSGVKVRAAELVTGDAYTVGACGTAGATWYRITKVGSKTVKSLYGASSVYAASGFFE